MVTLKVVKYSKWADIGNYEGSREEDWCFFNIDNFGQHHPGYVQIRSGGHWFIWKGEVSELQKILLEHSIS